MSVQLTSTAGSGWLIPGGGGGHVQSAGMSLRGFAAAPNRARVWHLNTSLSHAIAILSTWTPFRNLKRWPRTEVRPFVDVLLDLAFFVWD